MTTPSDDPSLAAFLTERDVDGAHLEHTARYLLAQWSQFRSPEQMETELLAAGIPASALESVKLTLSQQPDLLHEAALDVLSAAWNDPDLHAAAAGSVEEATQRLPVIEIGTIVIAVMYGLWLLTTRGRRSTTRTVRHLPDGSYEDIETTEWFEPSGPLRAIVDLLRPTTAQPSLPGPDSAQAPELNAPGPDETG